MAKTLGILLLGFVVLLALAAIAGGAMPGPVWVFDGGAGFFGDAVGFVVGGLAAVLGLLVAGVVLVLVLPVVAIVVILALLAAAAAVVLALLLGLAPLLLPVALVIGLVWLIAKAAGAGSSPALPPPAA